MSAASLMQRATAAHLKGVGACQPSASLSREASHEGRDYVVLANVSGTLSVYRVRNDGALKRLKRWPSQLGALQ